jgi:Xaa-Pro aminopeptidase
MRAGGNVPAHGHHPDGRKEMSMVTEIPRSEFADRISRIQAELARRNLDAYLVHSSEIDFANVLYLSNHWPQWETAGVIVPREGKPMLLIGPEAEPFARTRSVLPDIRKMIEYRESAEPEYPGIPVSSFPEVFAEVSGGKGIRRLGLGDYSILTMPVFDAVRKALGPSGELVRAEDIVSGMRTLKSPNELDLLRRAHAITEAALDEVMGKIKPGLTEKQVVGSVLEALYRHGAECEGFTQYVFSGVNTRAAISRSTHKTIAAGELIQLNIGARFGGYCSAIGRPVIIGKMPAEMKRFVQFGLDAHLRTYEWIRAGVTASDVARKFQEYYKEKGFAANHLYGPCHGTGIIEVEKPWMETSSDYPLQENMTFMADTFVTTPDFGLRWEDGFRVTRDGVEQFSDSWQKIIEL